MRFYKQTFAWVVGLLFNVGVERTRPIYIYEFSIIPFINIFFPAFTSLPTT